MVHLMEACLLTALQAYLLGSLLFGVLVSKLFYHDDVRLHGSGNAGMTNVLRTYGKLPAVITTIGDVGKSVVAVTCLRMKDHTPKAISCSTALSAMDFTGFYFPFTGEANLNVDCPASFLPSTIVHEMAHQRGTLFLYFLKRIFLMLI